MHDTESKVRSSLDMLRIGKSWGSGASFTLSTLESSRPCSALRGKHVEISRVPVTSVSYTYRDPLLGCCSPRRELTRTRRRSLPSARSQHGCKTSQPCPGRPCGRNITSIRLKRLAVPTLVLTQHHSSTLYIYPATLFFVLFPFVFGLYIF